MEILKKVELGLMNYYGSVTAYEYAGKFTLELEDYDETVVVEISEELFRAIEKEIRDREEGSE